MQGHRSGIADKGLWSALLLLAACAGPDQGHNRTGGMGAADPGKNNSIAAVEQACHDLHAAPPHLWQQQLPKVYQAGRAAEPFLIKEFQEAPSAPGAQATLAVLGRVGGEAAIVLCRELVTERAPLAIEAALALGDLPDSSADQALLSCVVDRYSDATLRTAAACSLARHGEREHAPRFLAAIVRAGSPLGRTDEKELGLPDKSRWARERYFVQRLLRKLGHDDLCDQLDSDAPWPVLEELAPRVAARLKGK